MTDTTSDTCTGCGDPAPDGPDYTTGRLCWTCADDRRYSYLWDF